MNTTQWAINEIGSELTGRVHLVINFIKPKGEKNQIDKADNLITTGWMPYNFGTERVIALACSLK